MIDLLTSLVSLPADVLKAIGTVAVGGLGVAATYVIARIKEARRPPELPISLPRLALDPRDVDLGFTLIRTGTDLTRALHDHGEILRAAFPTPTPPLPVPSPPPAPPAPIRRTRVRRTTP